MVFLFHLEGTQRRLHARGQLFPQGIILFPARLNGVFQVAHFGFYFFKDGVFRLNHFFNGNRVHESPGHRQQNGNLLPALMVEIPLFEGFPNPSAVFQGARVRSSSRVPNRAKDSSS
jgi:hypothetical protein